MSHEPILYSLASFQELILGAFDIAGARRIVEIGSEYGAFTREMCAYTTRVGGELVTVDPVLSPETAAFVESERDNPHFRFVQGTSLDVLPGLADADAFVIDGDHNYYTVLHELEAIAKFRGDRPLLVFEHDVCWPCGRRDWYFEPDRIPTDFLHPYAETGGMTLDGPDLVPGGWGDRHVCRIARHEGGPRNGVRTGIEDFLAGRPDLCFHVIPVIFGLGVIHSRSAPWSSRLTDLVRPLADNPLLERVERNRVEMALHHLRQLHESAPPPAPEAPLPSASSPSPAPPIRIATPVLTDASEHLCEQAASLQRAGRWNDAESILCELSKRHPDELQIWLARLHGHEIQGHHRLASLVRESALDLHPDWSDRLPGNARGDRHAG